MLLLRSVARTTLSRFTPTSVAFSDGRSRSKNLYAASCGTLALACICYEANRSASEPAFASRSEPVFSTEDVALRDGAEGRKLWVTYQGNVFDLTKFVQEHPGGAQFIRSAAGGAVEPWGSSSAGAPGDSYARVL